MVKQWMREYHGVEEESPEHALWLRQIRYQALKAWKVPIIVVSLSTLLELALLCFMAGLILLLWSLHLTLAIIVSTAVGVLILIAATATCMPVFFPNCPYKSPTGWCCVLLWDALVCCLYRILWRSGCIHQSSYLSCLMRHAKTRGWKERDLQYNLSSELQTRWGGEQTMDDDLKLEALKLSHLADAMAWVREKTQNDQMCSDVYSDAELSDPGYNSRICLLAPIYAFCHHKSLDPSRFMREQWYRYLPAHGRHGAFVFLSSGSLDEWNPWQIFHGIPILDVLSTMLLRRTEAVVDKILSLDADAEKHGTELLHALIGALCFLYHATRIIPTSTLLNEFVGFLTSLHNRLADPRELYDELFPSLRTFCVQIIQHLGSIEFIEHEICVDLRYRSMTFAHCTRAALHVYLRNRTEMSRENWHLFITLTDLALAKCSSRNPGTHEVDEMKALLQCMDEALQMVLDSPLRNCGYYDQLPWIETLIKSPTTVFKHMPISLPKNIHKINKYTALAASRGSLEKLRQRWNIVADKNIYLASKDRSDDTTSITTETGDTDTTVYEQEARVLRTAASTSASDVVVSPAGSDIEEDGSSTTNVTSRNSSGHDISVSSATSAHDISDSGERLPDDTRVITASRTNPRQSLITEARETLTGDNTYEKRLHTLPGLCSGLYLAVPTEDDGQNSNMAS
ncbi:hypothetical protein EIP86_011109 [Pleurotus ostreatoroseus]|nr:hypothetical protein EIP86_011109 [Pleurotus ostreatoroseus]